MPPRPVLTPECPCGGALTPRLAKAKREELFCPRCGAPLDMSADDERQALREAAAGEREWRGKNRGLK